ncbi:MAG: transglycosylase domain-containing protein [Alphaproteobacteria bacterium]|nr:transglycosylase domain-containing protein [Alphaproteobacteria bacterium]
MALKITCPHCGEIRRLSQPYPLPGTEVGCDGCGRSLAISYPAGMVDRMRDRGVRFDDPYADPPRSEPSTGVPTPRSGAFAPGPAPESPGATDPRADVVPPRPRDVTRPAAGPAGPTPAPRPTTAPRPAPPPSPTPQRPRPTPADTAPLPPRPPAARSARPTAPILSAPGPAIERTAADRTVVDRPGSSADDRTERLDDTGPRMADGLSPARAAPPPSAPVAGATAPLARPVGGSGPAPAGRKGPARTTAAGTDAAGAGGSAETPVATGRRGAAPEKKKRGLLFRMFRAMVVLCLLGGLAGGALVAWAVHHYGQDLPSIEQLSVYEPPTVTVVRDRNGEMLGEIFEKRRYVVPLEEMPQHLEDAFLAAEDARFYEHDGVDYQGIARAILRNAAKGKKAQGASTITQQVARNFLLSSEKTYERKIREILLSQRIEEAFDKEHILYLYLNQIYLGSGAYGVQAASRVYFGKDVADITLAEAAILAGLPQRPSDYSPHQHWDKARARQEYVLGQMRDKGFIDTATYDAALAEVVEISPKTNDFLTQAPYFTEHIRRYLVDTYGFDKIYNDGLVVDATCDLTLQKAAQLSVHDNVLRASNSIGWRGAEQTLPASEIDPWLAKQDDELRKAQAESELRVAGAGGGYGDMPAKATLTVGQTYPGVVLEVAEKHAVVGVGKQRALVPLSWSKWMYEPNPERSYKVRVQRDLTEALKRGDVVEVLIEGADMDAFEETRGYDGAGAGPFWPARVIQDPEIEGALLSYRLEDGAVLAMVGGYSFEESEFNRATQAMRQVGSTFKPVVYAAAIGTEQFTAGSLVSDAPTVFGVLGYGLYKPGNYGGDYLGLITLRRALQLSRNVVTVRVLDKIGLEPVFELAGPTLRIGYDEPQCSRTHVAADAECPGTMTPSAVEGMAWCEHCDPTSCPLIEVTEGKQCLTQPESHQDREWCRSCDQSLRACNWVPQTQIGSRDACMDPRIDDETGEVMCRACDLSMGLGSSSLTMVEIARAYSVFATYGKLVEPHWIERVLDRDGTVIEAHSAPDGGFRQVLDPSVAGIAHWLLREVATGGTGAKSNQLGIHVAGKTGTTNDFKDAWFVGYNTELVTAAWVGYDQPKTMGVSFTGGDTALPVWMDYMRVAAPKEADKDFPPLPQVEMVAIDERTGAAARGGRPMPFLRGTSPTNVVGEVGQKTADELLTSDF